MNRIIGKSEALYSLFPVGNYELRGNDLIWFDTEQAEPTSTQISTEVTRLQAAYDAQAYARSRKAKYDQLNQDEMRYDDLINSTTTWQDAIAAIKTEYPK